MAVNSRSTSRAMAKRFSSMRAGWASRASSRRDGITPTSPAGRNVGSRFAILRAPRCSGMSKELGERHDHVHSEVSMSDHNLVVTPLKQTVQSWRECET
jgi:hypothetical protein